MADFFSGSDSSEQDALRRQREILAKQQAEVTRQNKLLANQRTRSLKSRLTPGGPGFVPGSITSGRGNGGSTLG